MARFRVRNLANNDWYDCADTPMFIRTKENTWQPLTVETFAVRGLHGKRWYNIDANYDPNFDDPCINQEVGNCGGSPTSTTKGSGTGDGSRGPKYDPLKGYPAGYDLPDAMRTGFGVGIGNVSPTSRYLTRPGIRTIESYDPTGLASKAGLGTWTNPNVPWASVHARGAVVTETIYAIPRQEGYVEITFASYHADGLSVDVYSEGIRVASTCGKVGGRGRIKFLNDPDAEDMRIMIRVRTTQGANWSLQVIPPKLNATSDRGNLALDLQASYDVLTYPDVIIPDYIGTPIFPAPCHATVWPIAPRILDSDAFEYYHYIGNNAGYIYLNYTSWDNLDYIEVYHAGRRIASTQEAQTGLGYLYFLYDPAGTANYDLMVRVVAKDFGKNASLNSFYYSLYCPSERGAREYRFPCQSDWIVSAGHPTTEDNFSLGTQTDDRAVLINVRAGSFDTLFEVFDQNMNRLDYENLLAGQTGTLEFWKLPAHTLRSNITVRVTSGIGCDWSYYVYCPIQPPKLSVQDFMVPYNCLSVDPEPLDMDMLPWFCYEIQQTGGRSVSKNVEQLKHIGDDYGVLWGGTNGWFKFNNYFNRPIKQITIQWKYDGRNGAWHGIDIYERFAGAGAKVHVASNSSLQTLTLSANVPAGQEIWINWSGGGDRGDGNNIDYLSIINVVFE